VNIARGPIRRRTAHRLGLHAVLARPAGILQFPRSLTDQGVAELKRRFDEAQVGKGMHATVWIKDEVPEFMRTGRLRVLPARRGGVRRRRRGRIRR
jgi:hypothetical protein